MRRQTLYHWLYRLFYVALGIGLLGLLAVTPVETIIQARGNGQFYYSFVIAGAYVLTAIIAVCMYLSRMLANRYALKNIPKSYIPVEKDDVKKYVREMVVASLSRSAVIAWDSRPRVPQEPETAVSDAEYRDDIAEPVEEATAMEGRYTRHWIFFKKRVRDEKQRHLITIPPPRPVWGEVEHEGWSSPTSPDLPNLQYVTVISELPHLIEARAVSLAPADPDSTSEPRIPDARAVDLLQRPAAMALREYISHLVTLGVVPSPPAAIDFLADYEHARFSGRPLSEARFRELMRQFADLLRGMTALSPAILTSLDIDDAESDLDDDRASSLTPVTPRSRSLASSGSITSHSGSEGTIRTRPPRSINTDYTPSRRQDFSTAPATPRSKTREVSRSPSTNSFAQSRRPYLDDGSSSSSLRSTSQRSVIRLSNTNDRDALPYSLTVPGMR